MSPTIYDTKSIGKLSAELATFNFQVDQKNKASEIAADKTLNRKARRKKLAELRRKKR